MASKISEGFGLFDINGKRCIKYADIHIFEDSKCYDLVFVKIGNYFTILMDDIKSYPTVDLLKEALAHLKDTDFTVASQTDKPDSKVLGELLTVLDNEKQYFCVKNYILRTTKENVAYNSTPYFVERSILPKKLVLLRTNIQFAVSAIISRKDCELIKRYDKRFSLYKGEKLLNPDLLCIDAVPIDDSVCLRLCSSFEYLLRKSSLNKTLVSGTKHWHLETLEFSINIDRDEEIGVLMEGEKLSQANRRFFFVFSITGIKVRNDIRFGLVTFTKDCGISKQTENDFQTRLSKAADCYAQLMVTNTSLLSAAKEVISILDKALNLLLLILFDDSSKRFFSLSDDPSKWHYDVLDSRVEVDSHFFVEDVLNNCYAVLSSEQKKIITTTQIEDGTEKILDDDNLLEDFFYGSENKIKSNLLQSIFWLNESYKKRGKKERIISLYNAIEFLLTGQTGETLSDCLSTEYGEEYEKAFESIKECISNIGNEQLRDRIGGVIKNGFEGNASVQSKLAALLEQLNIPFSEDEWRLFKKLKDARHKLIHNKKSKNEITEQELDELYHVVSRVIVCKIISIKGDGEHD